jgi:spermidine dehydrogenase
MTTKRWRMPRITRRDFLNGVALTIASGLTPAAQVKADPARYPPALTGLRGQHDGSFEVAHAVVLEGRRYPIDSLAVEESYDLVVVGGGISGLAAAWFYRRAAGDGARILVLDNHDDFGGHAKRNEFTIDGRTLIGYGGSQSLQSPKTLFSPVARGLLRDLGVTLGAFETAFDRSFYSSLGLARGVFFAREAFGRDVLIAGDALTIPPNQATQPVTAKPLGEFVASLPLTDGGKAQLLALHDAGRDPLRGKSPAEKKALLRKTSYRDYLIKVCGCSEEVANCFQGRPLGFFGLGCDAVPAADLAEFGYPGFAGLGLTAEHTAERREPYIYHFPDGNAAIARLLVRALIPDAAPGHTMDDVVLAPFDYASLDRPGQSVRVRLDSTCVDVQQENGKVRIGYVHAGTAHRIEAKHAVLGCFHMMIPHIMPSLPAAQREALAANVKTPLVYTNVLVRNWRPWTELKVSGISAPMSFHNTVALDFPVSMGGYKHPHDPDKPILLHLAHVPGAPGHDARTQFRIGQGKLYQMTFADFEERIRDELDRMLGPGGFVATRDIAAITVNRWPHGYGYTANSLFDPDDYDDKVVKRARQTVGRVAIANSDAGGDAYVHLAIDQAERAVRELLQR